MSDTAGAISRAGITYLSGALTFTYGFHWVRVARSLIFCVVFCRSLFVLLSLIVVLQLMASNYLIWYRQACVRYRHVYLVYSSIMGIPVANSNMHLLFIVSILHIIP